MVKPGTKTMVMVKALAYGSGSREISHLLEFNKVDYLAVAYADEGVELRKSGVRLPVMVMNADEAAFNQLDTYQLQPEIFDFTQLNLFLGFLKEQNKISFPVHLKLDTGMHRLGFIRTQLDELCKILKENRSSLKIESVFTHLSSADMPSQDDYTLGQIKLFEEMAATIGQVLDEKPLLHVLNSPGIERFAQYSFDMVRLGIGLHGIAADAGVQKKLSPVHTLVSRISHIEDLHEGDTVGYARRGVIHGDRRIAVVPIGYADGYFRWYSNGKGKMLVNGKLAPVVGNVCMDMTMIDITEIPQTQIGDEVIVFGEALPVGQVAAWAETIPYELLTSVSTRVKRIYVDNV
jgi:alanine racemase